MDPRAGWVLLAFIVTLTCGPGVTAQEATAQTVRSVFKPKQNGDVRLLDASETTHGVLSTERSTLSYVCKADRHSVDQTIHSTCERPSPTGHTTLEMVQGHRVDRCPNGWSFFGGHCYKRSAMRQTWDVAKQSCERQGASLARIENEATNKFINKMVTSQTWFLLNDRRREGIYEYEPSKMNDALHALGRVSDVPKRTPVMYTAWAAGQPSNTLPSEDCVVHGAQATWFVRPCEKVFPFICSKPSAVSWIKNVSCPENAEGLNACTLTPAATGTRCSDIDGVKVACSFKHTQAGIGLHGSLQAVSVYEGLLQVWHDNKWNYMCGKRFTQDHARVVCQQLRTVPHQMFKMSQGGGTPFSGLVQFSGGCAGKQREERVCVQTTEGRHRCHLPIQDVHCQKVQICGPDRYGEDCSGKCGQCSQGRCSSRDGHCPQKQCEPGYQGAKCDQRCNNKWGLNCTHPCGRCAEGQCDVTNGRCPGGRCEDGYHGPLCTEKCPNGRCEPTCPACTSLECTTHEDQSCPKYWKPYGKECFKVVTEMKQWQAARDHCRSVGGYLARITSAGVNGFLTRQLKSQAAWFHLTDSEKEGRWSDGTTTAVTYMNWAASEPNNAGGSENCACIMGIGEWTDENCGMPKAFICARGRESSPDTPAGTLKDQTENKPDGQQGFPPDTAPVQTTDQTQDRPKIHQGSSSGSATGSAAGQTPTRPNRQRRCSVGWATLGGQCYKVVPIKQNWDEARQYCRILGADLAQIPNAEVNKVLSKWIPEKAWFYVNDKEQEGRFTNGSAGPLEYTNWRPGEPNNYKDDEDCAALMPDERAGLWNDESCATENYIICGKAPTADLADQDTSNNQGCPLNWSFYGGKCYKADQVRLNWYQASVQCQMIGGGLARITSEGINQHLRDMTTQGAWFYLSDKAQEGRFVDGTVGPLRYKNWNKGEPNDGEGSEDCATLMIPSGKWNDAHCMVRLGVLCEKDPVNQVTETDMDGNNNTQTSQLGCTVPWRAFRDSCYGVINTPRTWQKGQAYCRERGGDLAKITSEEINRFLSPMVRSRAWFFTNDRENEGRFVPQPLRYSNWESGEPNDNLDNEDCGELVGGLGRWNDQNCDQHNPFICEIKSSCSSREWTMFNGVCYLASNQRLTWEEGREFCRRKGADYARIRSEELNSFISGLIHERTWILLHDKNNEGTFEDESGQPLSYTKWRPAEPNNMFGEDCVFMHSDSAYAGLGGTWVDADCNERRNFLCAKEASFNPSVLITEDVTDPDSPVNSNPSDTGDEETLGYPDELSATDYEEEDSIAETSPVSPEDEPCAPEGQNCIDEFRQNVQLAQTDPFRNLKDICRGVASTSACVRRSLQHCVEEVRGQVQEAFDRQMADITRNCPGDCELQRGETCTRNLSTNIANTLLAQDGTCDKVQGHVDEARACVHQHVTACGQEERRVYDDAISLMETEGKKACVVPTVTPPSQSPGIRCLTCDKSSKEDCRNKSETVFCPQNEQRCVTITYPSHSSPKLMKSCGSPAFCGTTPKGGTRPLCCSTDLCNDFTERGPPKPWVPPSEPDTCDWERASTCLHELTADTVSEILRKDDAEWSYLCRSTLTQKKGCISKSVSTCWQSTQERFDRATLFIEGIFGDCTDANNPGLCDMAQANDCIETFRDTVNAYGGTYRSCGSFTPTIDCVNENMKGCSREDRESMNETLTEFLRTSRRVCRPVLEMTSPDAMTIVEGGDPGIIKYRINHPATMICRQPNCKVYIHLELEDGIWPRCWKDRKIIKQAVFGIPEPKTSDTCGDLVTDANYKQERHVPVAAKLDFKFDGPQMRDVRVVLKHVINGQEVLARVLSRIKLSIQERDIKGLCKSVNDPHMTTFNGRYYNNHKEGKFILYKSTRYPYEVQTVYQRCNAHLRVTCNCAVAIRSGDTVFVVDRCRRMSVRSSAMKTYIHQHDRITPGTRFFRLHGGRRYHVVLPHGTMVKVTASGQLINVFVVASPADYKSTQGLCGFYDEGKHNDFKMRNGAIYNGPGSQRGGQPDRFSEEWRVRTGEDIFRGVAKASFSPTKYCGCGTENEKCCSSNLMELCDTDTSGEITQLLQAGTVTQPASRSPRGWYRGRRSTNDDDDEDDIEFSDDDDTQPFNVTWPVNRWTEESSRKFCRDYIFRKNKAGARCLQVNQMELATFDLENDVEACVEDIKATGNTTWASAALDSMQASCQVAIERETKVADSAEGREVAQSILEETCMNQCNDQGQCINGSCDCEEGWAGEDCSIRTDAVPEELTMPGYGLCDLRQRECTDGIVFGVNFINTSSLTCHLQEVSITGDQVSVVRSNMTVTAEYFSFNQIRCPLPRPASYYVAVSNNGQQPSPAHLMLTHDSACYTCDPTGPKCTRKPQGNCVIKGECYDDGENNPDNSCLVCRSSESNSDWHWETSCGLSPGWKAGIITGVIAAVATTVTLAVLIKMKKKNKLFDSNFSLDEIPKLTKVK